MNWNRTKVEPAPNNIEVLLSDGKNVYLGTYDAATDYFYDQNRFTLPAPKYWHELPRLISEILE